MTGTARISDRAPRRAVAVLAALALAFALLPLAPSASADTAARDIDDACGGVNLEVGPLAFTDIAGFGADAQDAIRCLGAYGITVGFGDGTFRPGVGIQRYQMALFLARVVDYAVTLTDGSALDPQEPPFTDTDDFSAEAQDAIALLYTAGVTQGTSETEFSPHETVSRRDMASFLVRLQDALEEGSYDTDASDLFSDVPDDLDRSGDINALAEQGIVQGFTDGTYRPFAEVSRGHMALFVMRHIDENVASVRLPGVFWYQSFNHNAAEWAGVDVDGPEGWCGSIERHDRDAGPVTASAGGGYAVATGGECNEFWADVFGADFRSGPFAVGTPPTTEWPANGYTMELDVYLGGEDAFDFDYYVSIFDEFDPEDIHYFEVPVLIDDGVLTVHGHEVDTTGWHTFRHRFAEEADGSLSVEFELAPRGEPALFTESVDNPSLFGEPGPDTAAFDAHDIGSGYVWLHLPDGEDLPIDEYRVLRQR